MNLASGLLCAAWLAGFTGVLAAVLTPLFARLARRWGAMDIPGERSLHAAPTPLLGGLAILAALIVTTVTHLAGAAWLAHNPEFLKPVLADLQFNLPGLSATWGRLGIIFAGGIAMSALGVADDFLALRVRTRLVVQFAIAIAIVSLGIRPSLAILPAPLPWLVGVVWLVGITNAFNLIDGVDGLATGLAAIATGLLGATMFLTNHPCTAALLFAICGACLGFLWHNWYPAKVFLGSAGALFLGYMIGATTMVATFQSMETTWLFPMLIPALVCAVPLYDTASVVLIRIGLKRRIWEGDRSHFHHRLLRIGFSHRQCVVFMWLIALAFGLGGMLITRGGWIASTVVSVQALVLLCVIVLMERVVGRVANPPVPAQVPSACSREADREEPRHVATLLAEDVGRSSPR